MDNPRIFLFAAMAFVSRFDLATSGREDYGPTPGYRNHGRTRRIRRRPPWRVAWTARDLPVPRRNPGWRGRAAGRRFDQRGRRGRGQLLQVDTDVLRVMIDTRGGVLRSVKLKQYPTSLEQPDDWLELVHDKSDTVYIVQSGLLNKQELAPTHASLFESAQTGVPARRRRRRIARGRCAGKRTASRLSRLTASAAAITWSIYSTRSITAPPRTGSAASIDSCGRSRPLETSRLLYTYTGSVYFNEADKYEKGRFRRHRGRPVFRRQLAQPGRTRSSGRKSRNSRAAGSR